MVVHERGEHEAQARDTAKRGLQETDYLCLFSPAPGENRGILRGTKVVRSDFALGKGLL